MWIQLLPNGVYALNFMEGVWFTDTYFSLSNNNNNRERGIKETCRGKKREKDELMTLTLRTRKRCKKEPNGNTKRME